MLIVNLPYQKVHFSTAKLQFEKKLDEALCFLDKLKEANKVHDIQNIKVDIKQFALSRLREYWLNQEEIRTEKND